MSVSEFRRFTTDVAEAGRVFPETAYYPSKAQDFGIDVHCVVTDQCRADHFRTVGTMTTENEPTSGQCLVIAGDGVAGMTVNGHPLPTSTVSLAPARTFFTHKEHDTEYDVVVEDEEYGAEVRYRCGVPGSEVDGFTAAVAHATRGGGRVQAV